MESNDPFSKYQIGEVVGKGAFGKVYKALNIENGDFCAIKQIEKSIISEKQLPSILQEIKLLQTLQHNNIVRFIESHETPKYLFFALEFVEGGTLGKMVKRYGNFQEPLLARYVCQVLSGLAYLHEKGVIHRDIKSDNILITKDGVVKLADFGSCTYSALDRKLTVVGTPFWMAPEVIQMDMNARSTACDIWSLGCTILELLTGNPPYWDLGTMPAMFAMVNNPHPPLPANISAELKNFLLACFIRDIHKRPTAAQLLEHPWIKLHQQQAEQEHQVKHQRSGSSKLSVSTHAEGYQDEAVEEDENDLKERIAILELQKKEQAQTIQKLKYHFVKALKEKKAMKEMIAQLVQERDGYMIKLGLNPPPPPAILLQTQITPGSTPTRSALENANEIINVAGGKSGSSQHFRSASQSSPMLKSSGSFRGATSGGSHSASGSLNNGGGHGSSSSSSSSRASMANILTNEFFQPPDSYSDEDDDTPSSPTHDYLMTAPTLSDLHIMGPPKVTKRPEQMGAYLSSGSNLQVYKEASDNNNYSKSPHQYSIGGALNINHNNNSSSNSNNINLEAHINNNNGGSSSSSSSGRKPPMLQKESSQKTLLNQYITSPSRDRRDSVGSSGKPIMMNDSSSSTNSGSILSSSHGSIGTGSLGVASLKPNHTVLPTISINHQQELEKEEQQVPPVEQVVVNVQPPRVGDTCKVKCGEGWYDAVVELVSGTTFVVTIKPFNIKQEVSHSDVTLAPLQLPDNTKKKSKFSIFKSK